MKLGYIGLGKMGKNMVFNMLDHKHEVVAWNRSPEPLNEVVAAGAIKAESIDDLVSKLEGPRVIWIMLTAGDVTEDLLFGSHDLVSKLNPGDIIIDGGNSNFNDSKRRAEICSQKQIKFLDSGTSGGPSGARNGACLMIGGEKEVYESLVPLFESLSVPNGFQYTGPAGSGHYVKMVHNSVEYGFLQAMGEGFEMIKKGPYENLNIRDVARIWNTGSVIESKIMRLALQAFEKDQTLDGVKGYIEDNGEAQWTIETALQYKIPVTTLAHSLFVRYRTRQDDSFAAKVVAVLRNQFGGHAIKQN
jgi:6-phosphogluconate dehydrogenase